MAAQRLHSIECADTHRVEMQQHQQDHTAHKHSSNMMHARSEVYSTAELYKLLQSATTSKNQYYSQASTTRQAYCNK
eukprot:15246-Heterococcus_DN1.PRE.1